MSWLITLIIGTVIGLLFNWASGRRMGALYSIITGIVGAITGYWLFIDVLRLGIMNTSIGFFSGFALIWEIIGSIVVMLIMGALYYEVVETKERVASEKIYKPGVAHEYRDRWEREHRKDDEDKS